MTKLEDMQKDQLISMIQILKERFEKINVREGDTSTTLYFFNTKNSVNALITINNSLIQEYSIKIEF